jgi:8-oxo-dGTP pyrophosphatase MutT (NUDIX family)
MAANTAFSFTGPTRRVCPRQLHGRHRQARDFFADVSQRRRRLRPKVARVGISEHIARLRAVIGHDLILVPSVSVLPTDRHVGHHDGWAVLGGAVEVGESPAQAAVRETREEIGVEVRLVRLLDVLGGPDYEVRYPNGDRTAYVTAVYEAGIIDGCPVADGAEVGEVAWFAPRQLSELALGRFARALLSATGYL